MKNRYIYFFLSINRDNIMKKPIQFTCLFVLIMFISCDYQSNDQSVDLSESNETKSEDIDVNANLNNQHREWHQNGQLKVKGQYKNNKKDSLWISYYPNGTKQSENYYSNNMLHGNTVTYYENGNPRYRGFYLEGEKHGKWLFWDLEGNEKKVQYKQGVIQ